jgi:hypothetical protein
VHIVMICVTSTPPAQGVFDLSRPLSGGSSGAAFANERRRDPQCLCVQLCPGEIVDDPLIPGCGRAFPEQRHAGRLAVNVKPLRRGAPLDPQPREVGLIPYDGVGMNH